MLLVANSTTVNVNFLRFDESVYRHNKKTLCGLNDASEDKKWRIMGEINTIKEEL